MVTWMLRLSPVSKSSRLRMPY